MEQLQSDTNPGANKKFNEHETHMTAAATRLQMLRVTTNQQMADQRRRLG